MTTILTPTAEYAVDARDGLWMSASDADRTSEYGEADQWPNDRNPIFFTGRFYGRSAKRPRTDSNRRRKP